MNKFYFSLFTFLIQASSTSFAQWNQLGSTIFGNPQLPEIQGMHVSINSNGTIFSSGYSAWGHHSGVKVFQWDGSDWYQLGQALTDSETYSNYGRFHSLSSDGFCLALTNNWHDTATIDVFHLVAGNWVNKGSTIYLYDQDLTSGGESVNSPLQLSGDGNSLVVSTRISNTSIPGGDTASVSVFHFEGTDWERSGDPVVSNYYHDEPIGSSVAINYLGDRIAINDFGGWWGTFEHIRVYEKSGLNWQQLGGNIYGDTVTVLSNTYNYYKVDLNSEGNIVSFSSFYNNGRVLVHKFDGLNWILEGDTINNDGQYGFAQNHALNDGGDLLAVYSVDTASMSGADNGFIQFHNFESNAWTLSDHTIYGQNNEHLGRFLDLDSIGTTLVTAGNYFSGLDGGPGDTKVFSTSTVGIDSYDLKELKIYPNPANSEVHVFLSTDLSELLVYDQMGSLIKSINNLSSGDNLISLDLPSGVYYLSYEIENTSHNSKLILTK